SDTVQLEESADVLKILFQFIEPPSQSRHYRQPSMVNMDADLFFRVAEAAEKYVVYSALSVCITRMEQCVAKKPLEVLNHTVLHGYVGLADKAAELSVS
ncbi:hypothetical protein BDN70DRAFT_771055, partial [Pholiota conissans]